MSDFNTLLAVKDLMKKNIVTAPSGATVKRVAELMTEKGISSVVLTAEDGAIAGIITETDIVREVVSKGLDANAVCVGDVMNEDVHSIAGSTSIFEARGKMIELKVKHMIVEENNKPVGIISATTLLGS